mgnify:CR=1 FL=1
MITIKRQIAAPKLAFNNTELDKSAIRYSYIAGIFDGEGCVSIYKGKSGFRVQVSIEMRDPHAIKYIASILNIRVIKKERDDENHVMYCVQMNNTKSLKFLNMVYPYLRVKKEQAMVAIKMLKYKSGVAPNDPFHKRIKKFKKWAAICKDLKKSSWTLAKKV